MQEGDVANLIKVLQEADYSPFMETNRPEFSFDEFGFKESDVIKLLSIYIWSNPYVDGGDIFFFDKRGLIDFWENLELVCGTWGRDMSIVLKGYHVLSELDFEGYHGMTIEGFLHPEMVENTEVTVENVDIENLRFGDDYFIEED